MSNTALSNDALNALCRRLTYNGARNLRVTVEHPHARFPDLVNGGQRFSTGRGKWTTISARGVKDHLKALKLAEERVLPWHGDHRDEGARSSLCVTPLGREMALYLNTYWNMLVDKFRT